MDIGICTYCKQQFKRTRFQKIKIKKFPSRCEFCSVKCCHNNRNKVLNLMCCNCQSPVERRPKDIRKSKTGNVFCCSNCSATYNNKHRKKSRRSKIEQQLFEKLSNNFPNIEFIANDKSMLKGYELDIAIPSLSIGIEWNGIVHLKPIYGESKLNKIQNIDNIKKKIAYENNINLIVIEDYHSTQQQLDEAYLHISLILNAATEI